MTLFDPNKEALEALTDQPSNDAEGATRVNNWRRQYIRKQYEGGAKGDVVVPVILRANGELRYFNIGSYNDEKQRFEGYPGGENNAQMLFGHKWRIATPEEIKKKEAEIETQRVAASAQTTQQSAAAALAAAITNATAAVKTPAAALAK